MYLVERAPELRFFGGYHALAGGVVDERDRVPGDEARTLARCAARELFEETGVLLPPLGEGLDPEARGMLRRALLDEGEGSALFWERLDAAPEALDALRPFGRLTTPAFAPVRYRTGLFHLELPAGEQPSILPGELVGGRWVEPRAELQLWSRGGARIVPPVLFLLHALQQEPLAAALDAAQAVCDELDAGVLHPVRCSPGILMVPLRTPTVPPATTTNLYLVGEEQLYLIDPATPYADEQERLFDLLDRLVADGRRLAGILATHHHADHVGAVAATSRRYHLPVHAHRLTLERLPPGFRRGRELADRDRLDLGRAPDGRAGWELIAYHTPGHDRGHLVFVESAQRAALVGDLVSTLSTIVIDPPEGHLATYLISLERMAGAGLSTLYPAHGPASLHPRRLLRRYLRHRAAREQALLAALERDLATLEELVPAVYEELDPALRPLAARSLLAGLEKLADEGRAREVAGGWRPAGR